MPQSDDERRQAIIQEEINEQAMIETQIRNEGSIFTNGKMGTSSEAKEWMEVNRADAFVNIVELLQKYNKSLKKLIRRRGRIGPLAASESDLNIIQERVEKRIDTSDRRVDLVIADIYDDNGELALEKRCVALEKRCHDLERKNKFSAKATKTKKNKINIFSNTVLKLETTIQELKDKIKDLEAGQADLESDQGELMGDIIKLKRGKKPDKSGSIKKRTHKKR